MPNRTSAVLLLAAFALAAAAGPARAQAPGGSAGPAQAPIAPAERALPLTELVERAWGLSRGDALADARAGELDARALANRATFAGAPVVGLDLRRDLPRWAGLPGTDPSPERGRNEIEPGIAVPVWLPGQRDAGGRLLERERALLVASQRAERLRLAGEVREAAWALVLAAAGHRLQQARADAALQLEEDVARRVDAGDLAPSDRLLARAERLAAQAAKGEAAARLAAARTALQRLAGAQEPGELEERPVADGGAAEHPALVAAREAVDVGRARFELARATRRDNPTVSMAARFDRDTYGGAWRNSLRVGVDLPLDTEARNAPRLATASAALAQAEVELARREREVAAGVEGARAALAAAREIERVQAQRAEAAREALLALERAFRAGERGLPEILRLRAQAFEAEFARELARGSLGLAIARLNQAHGAMP